MNQSDISRELAYGKNVKVNPYDFWEMISTCFVQGKTYRIFPEESQCVTFMGRRVINDYFNDKVLIFSNCEYCHTDQDPKETKFGVVCTKCGAPQ